MALAVADEGLAEGGGHAVVDDVDGELVGALEHLLDGGALPAGNGGGGVDDVAADVDGAAGGHTDAAGGDALPLLLQLVEEGGAGGDDVLRGGLGARGLHGATDDGAVLVHDASGDLGAADVEGIGVALLTEGVHGEGVLLGDPHGSGDHGADDDGVGAEAEELAGVLGAGDTALADDGGVGEGLDELGDELKVGAGGHDGVLGVAGEGGGDNIGASLSGGDTLLEGGDIGHNEAAELLLDLLEELNTGDAVGVGTVGDIEGDDGAAGLVDGAGAVHVEGDSGTVADNVFLVDANDGEVGDLADGGDVVGVIGTNTDGTAEFGGLGHKSHVLGAVEGILFVGLAGDDDASLELGDDIRHSWG